MGGEAEVVAQLAGVEAEAEAEAQQGGPVLLETAVAELEAEGRH